MKNIISKNQIISNFTLRQLLREKFDLIGVDTILLMNTLSEVHQINTANSKFILKIYRDQFSSKDEVEGEVELLLILHQHGLNVSSPLPNSNGDFLQIIHAKNELCYGVLYEFAPDIVSYNMDDNQIATVSREIARMHLVTANLKLRFYRKELNVDCLITQPIRRLKKVFKNLKLDYQQLSDNAQLVRNRIDALDTSLLSYGYCHYDLLPHNYHFNTNGDVTFFDFELSARGYLINDIVSFFAHYFLQVMHGLATVEEANHAFFLLIKNYTKVRPINDAEIKAFPYFGFAFFLYHLDYDYEHFKERSHPNYLTEQVKFLNTWIDWYVS